MKKRAFAAAALIAAVIAGIVFYINSMMYESTDDAYVESSLVRISSRVSGQIEEIYIKDNQRVNEGSLTVKIDDRDYKIKLEQAQALYDKALLSQKAAKADLNAVRTEINAALKDLKRYKKLYEAGAVSQQTLDTAQTRYDRLEAKLASAQERVLSETGSKAADAEIRALKAQRDAAALLLEYTDVKAPFTGTITKKNADKGRYVQPGQPLYTLIGDEVWIEANFKENQAGRMRAGQEAEIKIDAFPKKKFKGRIESIQKASGAKSSLFPPENASGSFVKIVQRIPVKIVFTEDIDFDKYNITPGMSAVPKVRIKD